MMKKTTGVLIALALCAIIYFIYSQSSKQSYSQPSKQTNTNIDNVKSDSITKLPSDRNTSSIVIDFSSCTEGRDAVYFGFGSTHFDFEGIKESNCVFNYGTEIENPLWDGELPYRCLVPSNYGKREYSVGNYGISMSDLEQFCTK